MSEPSAPRRGVADVRTDQGLRTALAEVTRSCSWEAQSGVMILDEVRRRGVRLAAHVASRTGARGDRGLVDDVVASAWTVMSTQTDQVLGADRPWSYVMAAAGRMVRAEAWSQRFLTSPTRVRGEARGWMPRHVDAIGATAQELESLPGRGHLDASPIDVDHAPPRCGWLDAFVSVLVNAGADPASTAAAVDRVSEVLTSVDSHRWETAARRDPVLAGLGLSPVQGGALVALMSGSRRSGRSDSLLVAVRAAHETGEPVVLTFAQRRRVRTFVDHERVRHPATTSPAGVQSMLVDTPETARLVG